MHFWLRPRYRLYLVPTGHALNKSLNSKRVVSTHSHELISIVSIKLIAALSYSAWAILNLAWIGKAKGMADLPQAEARPSFSQVVIQHIEPLSQLPGVQVDYARIVDLTAKQQYEDLRQLYHR